MKCPGPTAGKGLASGLEPEGKAYLNPANGSAPAPKPMKLPRLDAPVALPWCAGDCSLCQGGPSPRHRSQPCSRGLLHNVFMTVDYGTFVFCLLFLNPLPLFRNPSRQAGTEPQAETWGAWRVPHAVRTPWQPWRLEGPVLWAWGPAGGISDLTASRPNTAGPSSAALVSWVGSSADCCSRNRLGCPA